jgi:hypothetical protein
MNSLKKDIFMHAGKKTVSRCDGNNCLWFQHLLPIRSGKLNLKALLLTRLAALHQTALIKRSISGSDHRRHQCQQEVLPVPVDINLENCVLSIRR